MASETKIIESPYVVDIEVSDVVSWVFSSGTEITRQQPQYFDADQPSRNFSLSQAELWVKQVARGIQKLGLQPNDKVLLYSPNKLYFPILLWGVIASGCVFTAVAPSASETELAYQLQNSDAKLLLTHPAATDVAIKASKRVGLPETSIYTFLDPDEPQTSLQFRNWTYFWCGIEEARSWSWRKINSLEEAKSTSAIINYSSGTTGIPKGVEISHYNVVANSSQIIHKRSLVADTPEGRARKARLALSGDRWLAPLPMYHAFGQLWYCLNAARMGAKVYIMGSFDVTKYLLYLDIYRITFATTVPVILNMLAKYSQPEKFNLKAIEGIVSGSAPLSPDTGKAIKRLYLHEGAAIKQGMGLTETTCSLFQFAPDDIDDGRSIGWLNANCRAKIVAVDSEMYTGTAPSGVTVGEIMVSGPNIMKGYYRRPNETAQTIITDSAGTRWLRTGDIGYADSRGRFYVVDRMKELIKVKGLQVSPAELELALLQHPDVKDAAVVGAKLPRGEYPRAFVVRKTGTVKEADLFELIKSKFAPHKWLTGGVYFINEIPRNPTGKVMRRRLPKIKESSSNL